MHHAVKHKVIHNGIKIGGSLKSQLNLPDIDDQEEYETNLGKLKQSLKSLHISNLPNKRGRGMPKTKYINF
jgi:hypothetical protein